MDRSGGWRQGPNHSDAQILMSLQKIDEIGTWLNIFSSLYTFVVLLRFLLMLADISTSVALKLDLIKEIITFLTTFVVFLIFMIAAWGSCQNILFGS